MIFFKRLHYWHRDIHLHRVRPFFQRTLLAEGARSQMLHVAAHTVSHELVRRQPVEMALAKRSLGGNRAAERMSFFVAGVCQARDYA